MTALFMWMTLLVVDGPRPDRSDERGPRGEEKLERARRIGRLAHHSDLQHPNHHGIFTSGGAGRGVRLRGGRSKLAETYERAHTPLRRRGSKRITFAGLRRGDVSRSRATRMQTELWPSGAVVRAFGVA